jgi:hypothetical protein
LAGDTVLGVASVLLVLGAAAPVVEFVLFVLLGRPELGIPLALPLSELVSLGEP